MFECCYLFSLKNFQGEKDSNTFLMKYFLNFKIKIHCCLELVDNLVLSVSNYTK